MTEPQAETSEVRKRFPRIPHAVNGPLKGEGVTRDDIVLSKADLDSFFDISALTARQQASWFVTVQEKTDGANLGFFLCDGTIAMQNRSHRVTPNSATQWRGLDKFLQDHGAEILELLHELATSTQVAQLLPATTTTVATSSKKASDNDDENGDDNADADDKSGDWTLYGEWLAMRHSVAYESLPSPFLVFDIHHAPSDTFLATELVRRLLAKHCPSLHMVPTLQQWSCTFLPAAAAGNNNNNNNNKIPSWNEVHAAYHSRPSAYNPATVCEGGMVRLEASGVLIRRAKCVHDHFRQQIVDHWTAKTAVKNGITFG